MVHSDRPLQEKMTLFWHNHFATAYTKVAGTLGAAEGDALHGGEAVGGSRQACAARSRCSASNALGNFRDLLVDIAKDTAMLVWLDGRTNTRARPQENFGREIMELFTMGVGHYTEADVYAAARVFTGWNLTRPGVAADGAQHYEFVYNAGQHDTGREDLQLSDLPGRRQRRSRRAAAADGMQDGLDFIDALAAQPEHRRAISPRKLYRFFVSEFGDVEPVVRRPRSRDVYLQSRLRHEAR